MGKKVKISYALRPVVLVDDNGNKVVRYERFHPITTGNAVVVGGKTLTNKLTEYYTKSEIDANQSGNAESFTTVNAKLDTVDAKLVNVNQRLDTLVEADDSLADNIALKVDKVNGKQLSTEDFTTALKEKLDSLSNYNDSDIRVRIDTVNGLVENIKNALDTLTGKEDTTEIIDTLNEIVAFLDSYKNTENLAGILSALESTIHTWVEGKGYTVDSTLHAVAKSGNYNDLSNKPTIPTTLPANGGNADTVDGYHLVVGAAGTTANTIYFVV